MRTPTRPTVAAYSPFNQSIRPSLLNCEDWIQNNEPRVDIQPKISSHIALQALQVRSGPRGLTFNPSHIIRKRRHGFLSRVRTKNGRKTLRRRRQKGRCNMSH